MKRPKRERYLILSDFHVPDHDIKTLELILRFITFYQPDFVDILGDFVNFTKVSKFDQDPYYKTDLADEIKEGRGILNQIVKASGKAQISWYEGNHEVRLTKYLGRNASVLANLENDNEYVISIPHLFELKKLGIKWIPSYKVVQRHGVSFFHGLAVRIKSGFSAHANIDKFGTSGFTGHTHRLALITRTQSGTTRFWAETGSLCNHQPNPVYTVSPDWTQGFAVAEYSPLTKEFYPQIVPIVNHSFVFNNKLFS